MAGIYVNKINLRDEENNFYSFPNWVIGDYPTHITIDGQRNVPTRNIDFIDTEGNEIPLSGWTIGDVLAMLAMSSNSIVGNGGALYIDTSVDPPELKIINEGNTYPLSQNGGTFTAEDGILKWVSD